MKRPLIAINCSYDAGEAGAVFRRQATVLILYVEAVLEAGGLPLLVPPGISDEEAKEYAGRSDGFLFTGGDDYPPALYGQKSHPLVHEQTKERTQTDVTLMKLALASSKPMLCICAGMQLANIVSGGALIQHLDTAAQHQSISKEQDFEHLVTVQTNTKLYEIFGAELLKVNSAHHQAVDPQKLGEGLKVSAVAEDGVIEGLELAEPDSRFFVCVQWHPERIAYKEHRRRIFVALIDFCRK